MNILIKGLIIYSMLTVAIRFMGKRQIGELQPGELVTTMVLSEVATMPLLDDKFPVLSGISLVFLFVTLELLSSFLAMKFRPYRTLIQGHSVLIIKDGHLLKENLSMIRYSTDDLIEALRLKDVFDISQVKYAYVETNGALSVELKDKYRPVTPDDLKLNAANKPLTCLVISDGSIIEENLELCGLTPQKLENTVKKQGYDIKDIFIMTADKGGRTNIIPKEKKQ